MDYNLDKLNSMISSDEVYEHARNIMKEYQDAIEKIMADTVQADVQELAQTVDKASITDMQEFANEATKKRMAKHGSVFFETEIERVMDAFNDNTYDSLEFNLRCEILAGLKDSLIKFEFK
jgi:hypothetical protein